MKEIYKAFEKNYAVSNYGNIKNTRTGRILKLRKNPNGYLKTNISVNGKIQTVFVHRLVALMFLPNTNKLALVNHKDENKQNNCINNLEWCTNKYNSNYGTAKERTAKQRRKKVYQYDENNNLVEIFNSVTDVAKAMQCNTGIISAVCNGKFKKYKNYIWKY